MNLRKFWPTIFLLTFFGCTGETQQISLTPPKDRPFTVKWRKVFPDLFSVHFANPETGWAVGENGTVIVTINGGKTWEKQESGVDVEISLYSVHFVNATVGWAVGENGTIIATTNGGITWYAQHSDVKTDLRAIHFVNAMTGWAVGDSGTIITTTDSGNTWVKQKSGVEHILHSVYFVTATNGWTVGGEGTIITTEDGGQTWELQQIGVLRESSLFAEQGLHYPQKPNLYSVYFVNRMNGWAVGEDATLIVTNDSGKTWQGESRVLQGAGPNLYSVHFINNTIGWAVGDDGTIVETEDGGKVWTSKGRAYRYFSSKSDNDYVFPHLFSVYFVNETTGWAVGENGTIIQTTYGGSIWYLQDDKVWINIPLLTWSSRARPDLFSINFANETTGWATGEEGTIMSTHDGGQTWNLQESGAWIKRSVVLVALAASAAQVESGDKPNLFSVYFVNETTGWAVGEDGTIISTNDGGWTWKLQESGIRIKRRVAWIRAARVLARADLIERIEPDSVKPSIFSVSFVNEMAGWAVGESGTIISTKDGGKTWKLQKSGTLKTPRRLLLARLGTRELVEPHFFSVYFIDDKKGWATGESGTIISSDDGGRTWYRQASNTDVALYSVYFVNASTGWAVGESGTILSTTDGGKTWKAQDSRVRIPRYVESSRSYVEAQWELSAVANEPDSVKPRFHSVYFTNSTTGWVVGENGTIITTTDGGQTWKSQRSGLTLASKLRTVDLKAVQFAGNTCWAVGTSGTVLTGIPTNHAPVVWNFNVSESPLATVLKWRIVDENSEQVRCTKLEFRRGQSGEWQKIEMREPIAMNETGEFKFGWNPGSAPYFVREGTDIFYRVTLHDNLNSPFPHEIDHGFIYRSWWQRQNNFIKGTTILIFLMITYFGTCFLLLWLHPISLQWLHDKIPLQEYAQTLSPSSTSALGLKTMMALTFLPYFAQHPRTRQAWIARYRAGQSHFSQLETSIKTNFIQHIDCLDAWVERRKTQASEAFNRILAVVQRRIYIPMSLRVSDLETGQLLANPKPINFRPFFTDDRTVLAVIGGGGIGKSTLACQLARWALADKEEQRLAEHRMIPLFLEEETSNLLATITNHLKQMVGDDEIDQAIVESLLRHKRLLVITDALSERSVETQQHIESIHGKAPINAMIVTSRRVPNFGATQVSQLWPEKVQVSTLLYFLTEYLRRTNTEEFFPGRHALQLGDRLLALIESGSERLVVTPLLIKLFVDNAINLVKNKERLEKLPLSIPETMLEYLRRVNPQDYGTLNRVSNEEMIRAARVLGRCSLEVEDGYIPRDFYRDVAERALQESNLENNKAAIITRLVENGVLEKREVGGTQLLRFGLDSLAEYLAALYWLDKFRNNESQWRKWLENLRSVAGFPERTRGFLVALEDCVTTYKADFRLPDLPLPWQEL